METTERYRKSLKRKNCSPHTVKNYLNRIYQFTKWLRVSLPEVTRHEIGSYVDHLLKKRHTPKTIICHLQTLRLLCSSVHKRRNVDSIVMRSPQLASPAITLSCPLFTPHKRTGLQ